MIVLIIGVPGSGKGTQAGALSSRFGFTHLSTGDIFRAEMSSQSPLGRKAAEFVNNGQLVPDPVVVEMVASRIQDIQEKRYLLDGFPRNLEQAQALSAVLAKQGVAVDLALFLGVSHAEAVKRLGSRLWCGACGSVFNIRSLPPQLAGKCDKCGSGLIQRGDDGAATVQKRLLIYEEMTRPLVAYYRAERILHEIDGDRPPEAVSASLAAIVQPLLAAR